MGQVKIMTNELIKYANLLKKSNKFEFVEVYFSFDDLIKKMTTINPTVSYENLYQPIADKNLPLILLVIDSSLHRFNIYSETDLLTLKHLINEP